MSLEDIIEKLKTCDPGLVLPLGFARPHSYRGYYEDLAFEPEIDATIGGMLDVANGSLGQTFEGYKGGQYTMDRHTTCWLAWHGSTSENMIGPLLLDHMIKDGLRLQRKVKP